MNTNKLKEFKAFHQKKLAMTDNYKEIDFELPYNAQRNKLFQKYSDKIIINPELSRSLVSFQSFCRSGNNAYNRRKRRL